VRVTFAGIDFSEAPRDQIKFSGFEFGDHTDFSGCRWRGLEWEELQEDPKAFRPGRALFAGAAFGHQARFNGAIFGGWATLSGATFGGMPMFTGASFGDGADISGATFGNVANFGGATFGDEAQFDGATFGVAAIFENATFANEAIFTGAAFRSAPTFDGSAFGDEAHFDHTNFESVDFAGKSKEQWARDVKANVGWMGEEARKAHEKQHEDSWTRDGSGPDHFLTICFERARFDGEATFAGRTFERTADFTNTRFHYPPDFDTPTNAARIDFTGAYIGFGRPFHFHWTAETKVLVRLRAFRKIAEDHDLERNLYIEERKAERGVYLHQRFEELTKALKPPKRERLYVTARLITQIVWNFVMFLYGAFANYGRSFVLPFAWLIASGFFFYWCYGKILAPLMPKAGTLADKYEHAVGMVALGNAVPFVGPLTIDAEIKKFLFGPGFGPCLPIPPEGFQALVIAQNLFSITCVFFIVLALRNYFRIK
jgi:uncharacterized protein YjbI with pentapeptide repeats